MKNLHNVYVMPFNEKCSNQYSDINEGSSPTADKKIFKKQLKSDR